jgi:hypothetical protein
VVGNENGTPLRSISLANYLNDISKYTGLKNSLYCAERDSHALVSAQSCFLPVPPKKATAVFFGSTPPIQEPTKFYVNIYNYQSSAADPAVLAIIATSKGTSAQILFRQDIVYTGQKLYFNKNGWKHGFLAQRLTYDRIMRGEKDLTKPMTTEERQNNAIVVIQVPLTQTTPVISAASKKFKSPKFLYTQSPLDNDTTHFAASSPYPQPVAYGSQSTLAFGSSSQPERMNEPVDVENAIISLAEREGIFPPLEGRNLVRDKRFPVRVTIQWYKVTSSGSVNTEVIDEIDEQMKTAKSHADFWGSLVVDKSIWNQQNNRPTAPLVSPPTPNTIVGKHPDTKCDVCNINFQENVVRYRCIYCPDWDVCQNCFNSNSHNPNHLLAAVRDSTVANIKNNVRMANKNSLDHRIQCSNCYFNIVGARYVCAVCTEGVPGNASVNLCDSCADNCNHAQNSHPLIRVWKSENLKQIGLA